MHVGGGPLGAGRSAAGAGARLSRIGTAGFGALLGGLVGGFLVVGVTLVLKAGIDFARRQEHLGHRRGVPLLGLALPCRFCTDGLDAAPTTDGGQDELLADVSSRGGPGGHQRRRGELRGRGGAISLAAGAIRAVAILATVCRALRWDRGPGRLSGPGRR